MEVALSAASIDITSLTHSFAINVIVTDVSITPVFSQVKCACVYIKVLQARS